MKSFLQKNHRPLFYGCWILLGLLQCRFTSLWSDEAYYWVYSKYPAWGYFDHPPMISVLVKAGYAIFGNELGVRLFPFLLNTLSLLIIEKLTYQKNPFLFYGIVVSIAAFQIAGFLAVPDTPLLFFTALFFWCYQRFCHRQGWVSALLLGLSMALLLYSKYHGVLVILFTLLSNLKLLSKGYIYVAGVFAIACFVPHLLWQYDHHWPSINYQLYERNKSSYRFSFTSDYLLGQLLLPGPIAGFILLPAAFLYRSRSSTEKALRYTMIGFYVFFLLNSFRGRIEANWTGPVFVAIIVLSHQYLQDHLRWKKILMRLAPITVVLVLLARVAMVVNILPVAEVQNRFFYFDKWPQQMNQRTHGTPVVFNSAYQWASKYWFKTGVMAYSLNSYLARRSNYNYWPVEDSLLGKPVYLLDVSQLSSFPDSLQTPLGWMGYRYDSCFMSFAKIAVEVTASKLNSISGQPVKLQCRFDIPPQYALFIQQHAPILKDTTRIAVFDEKGWVEDWYTSVRLTDRVQSPTVAIDLPQDLPKGKYYLLFAINSGYYTPTSNSRKIEWIIN